MQPPSTHLQSNSADRTLGETWERNFCRLATRFAGLSLTPQQIGRTKAASWYTADRRRLLLPDITVWTAPTEHHEIKHKNPTRMGGYGLEAYRLEALLEFSRETTHPVLYTIHDWQLAGARNSREDMENRIEDWRTVEVRTLQEWVATRRTLARPMRTWLGGKASEVPGYYWPATLWRPLAEWWITCPRRLAA